MISINKKNILTQISDKKKIKMQKIVLIITILVTIQGRTIKPKKYKQQHETNPTNNHQVQHSNQPIQINASTMLKANKCY